MDTDEEKPADRVDTVRVKPADRVDTFRRRSGWAGGGVGSWLGGRGGDGGSDDKGKHAFEKYRRRRRAIFEAGHGRAEIGVGQIVAVKEQFFVENGPGARVFGVGMRFFERSIHRSTAVVRAGLGRAEIGDGQIVAVEEHVFVAKRPGVRRFGVGLFQKGTMRN